MSNICMRRKILSLCFLLIVSVFSEAQSRNKAETAAILRAKNALVSSFDSSLPKVSLEFFLKYEAGGAPITWERADCGQESANPPMDHGSGHPLCVAASFDKGQTAVTVIVSVGTLQIGRPGTPALLRVSIDGPSGRIESLRLRDLPRELHRPAPREPRDLSAPTIASSG